MSRTALRFGVALAAMLALTLSLRGEDREKSRINSQLAVMTALRLGLDHIQRGDFTQAVTVLEKQLGMINGNREYLVALRDAYRGHVKQLQTAGRHNDVKLYMERLAILEPAASVMQQPPPVVSRGKVEQDTPREVQGDPFSKENKAQPSGASSLVAQAEAAFDSKQYERACELFAQANQMSSDSVANSGERWGYCKLVAVARSINNGDVAQSATLKQEIRQALTMSPRLLSFADDLLKRLESAATGPSVNVKHTPRQNGSWAVAETANFRIFHVLSAEEAEKIARIAENTRVTMTRKWLNEEATDWKPRCDLYIHPTGKGYAQATGAPSTAPGHSTIKQDGGRVLERRIDLRGDDANMTIGVLPHETTHVVLAGRFGTHYVPRWADEGMAVLSEPRERVNLHLRNLPKHQREQTLFGVAELMKLSDYPEPRRVGPFYAQSVSLVDFMCQKKDPATFARFLREALDSNYESALRRHYGYQSSADLEREWQQHAFGDAAVASVTEKRLK